MAPPQMYYPSSQPYGQVPYGQVPYGQQPYTYGPQSVPAQTPHMYQQQYPSATVVVPVIDFTIFHLLCSHSFVNISAWI
jgi:hypothetical protein